MIPSRKKWQLQLPPYRQVPESARQIYIVQCAVVMLPAAAAVVFFGIHAAMLMLVGLVVAAACEWIVSRFRHETSPGSMIHSLMIALVCVLMLPAKVPLYVAFMAAAAAVLVGKHFFGGLGRYLWHPALIGRLVVQLFYHNHLSGVSGSLLAKSYIVLGDINQASKTTPWFGFDWFNEITSLGCDGFILEKPIEVLRHLSTFSPDGQPITLGQFLLDRMPSLSHCIIGAVPGGMGETCGVVLILAVVYMIYRGYLRWHLPVMFLLSAWLAAALLPVPVAMQNEQPDRMWFIWTGQGLGACLTYLNYHLFSGGLLFGATLLTADMTSRPIAKNGQILFAIAAGTLTMIFRIYTPIPIPCYAAILAVAGFIPTIDRITRPKFNSKNPQFR